MDQTSASAIAAYASSSLLPPVEFHPRRLTDRVILVTGASSGIGEQSARRFAAEGAAVVLAARRADRIEAIAREICDDDGEAAAIPCDVTRADDVKAAVQLALDRFGRLDGALNNAGTFGANRPLHRIPDDIFDRVVAVNLRGVFLAMKYEIAAMLTGGGGTVVNVSSVFSVMPVSRLADYCATKAGVDAMTRCAAVSYADRGIRVNAIQPGPTWSELIEKEVRSTDEIDALRDAAPMRQLASGDDMARLAVFLMSDESRFITGTAIPSDGGLSAGRRSFPEADYGLLWQTLDRSSSTAV